ncbi:hypothetical protein CBS63078_7673 [Aspergillus niger]|nr:hypothetical protein CBS115989_8034 [Aspergillus niger]KAI2818782.1 hypothetical protein CBS133816_10267 [Aspergillus niger]KAI2838779.1 hypothetical protein CBS12448_10827 [Aspergillus niger]KAI2843120.1 hypothetical protein CBS11350_5399 [Aspergillus niger]KAI2846806.1 hypothetical protein CBS11232_7306 [Aspergillus niger]
MALEEAESETDNDPDSIDCQFSYSTSQPSINPSTYDGLSTTAFCYHFHITSSAFPVGYAGVFQLWRHKLSTTFLIGSVVVESWKIPHLIWTVFVVLAGIAIAALVVPTIIPASFLRLRCVQCGYGFDHLVCLLANWPSAITFDTDFGPRAG